MSPINTLPNELVFEILGHLEYLDLRLTAPFVSKRFRTLVQAKSKDINQTLFGDQFIAEKTKTEATATDEVEKATAQTTVASSPASQDNNDRPTQEETDTGVQTETEKNEVEEELVENHQETEGNQEANAVEQQVAVEENENADEKKEGEGESKKIEVGDFKINPTLSSLRYGFKGDLKDIVFKDRKDNDGNNIKLLKTSIASEHIISPLPEKFELWIQFLNDYKVKDVREVKDIKASLTIPGFIGLIEGTLDERLPALFRDSDDWIVPEDEWTRLYSNRTDGDNNQSQSEEEKNQQTIRRYRDNFTFNGVEYLDVKDNVLRIHITGIPPKEVENGC